MQANLDDAVAMYARACRAWYGAKAEDVVTRKAVVLRQRGDHTGAEIWERLVPELKRVMPKKAKH